MSVASLPETVAVARSERQADGFSLGRRYIAEVFDGADKALDAIEAAQLSLGDKLVSSGFQSLNWLTMLYEELAPAKHAMPRVIVVTERSSREIAYILPLVVSKVRLLRTARFADLGVADYNGPLLGPAAPVKPRAIRRAWRSVRRALKDVDFIRLENMPLDIAGRPNPLASCRGIAPSRRNGTFLTVAGTVDEYLECLGKKHRKEIERCTRLWQNERGACFARATRPEDIARAFSVLDEQQAARFASQGIKYYLTRPEVRPFYERLVMDGTEVDLCRLFTLEAGEEILATLLAMEHEGTATVLRVSHAGDAWSFLSPGRLICVEAMRYFVERGVRRFDLGRGETEFKASIGADPVPLIDVIAARDLAAVPRAAYFRLKARARKNPRFKALARGFSRLWPH